MVVVLLEEREEERKKEVECVRLEGEVHAES